MNQLGNLLRKYIDNSGYTIYKAAHKANLNRTTLQKVLTNERTASEEFLHKLLPVLKLSPDEETELWESYEIRKIGEPAYQQRKCVRCLIESIAELDSTFCVGNDEHIPDIFTGITALTSTNLPAAPVQGIFRIQSLLSYLLSQEYGEKNAAGQNRQQNSCPNHPGELLIHAPGNLPIIKQLFAGTLRYHRDRVRIHTRHITPLLKARENSTFPLTNLEILSNILPFALSQTFHYEVYCFYTSKLLQDSLHSAFPYYVILGNTVVLLSSDGQTAFPFTESAATNYFRNLFNDSIKKTSCMLDTNSSPSGILDDLIKTDQEFESSWILKYHPSFTAYLTDDMIHRYLRSDLLQRDLVMTAARTRIRQLSSMNHYSNICSKEGLWEFAATGILSDLQPFYAHPLQASDRIVLLKALYIACKSGKQFIRLVNPVTLSLPRHLCFIIRQGHCIDFTRYNSQNISFNYIHITESGIIDAFEDFYSYLGTSNLVYSKDDTLKEIENVLISLSAHLP